MTTTISAGASYTLGANEDNLQLTGTANINGNGNALNNVLTGNSGINILKGMGGVDTLYGADGADTLFAGDGVNANDASRDVLYGGAGNDVLFADGGDVLYGQAGNDTLDIGASTGNLLDGGAGNDLYRVNSINNAINEMLNGGTDTIESTQSVNLGLFYSEGAYIAGALNVTAEIENVKLTGSMNAYVNGNRLANTLTGNAGDNTLKGMAGVDVLSGGAGNDVLEGGTGADNLSGGDGNDILYATAPGQAESTVADSLNGGAGNDVLYLDGADYANGGQASGADHDIYIVDGLRNFVAGGLGFDEVRSSTSFSGQRLDANGGTDPNWSVSSWGVEVIELTGSLNSKALGSYLQVQNYTPAVETLLGNSGDNVLEGCGGNDVLDGRAGNDTLVMYADAALTRTFGQKYAVTTGKASWTGGDGQDTFWIGKAYVGDHSSGADQLTITDFTHSVDTLRLGINANATAPVALRTLTANSYDTLASLVEQGAMAGSELAPTLTMFEFEGNTYLVLDQNSVTPFTASTDLAICLTGTPGLTLSDVVFAAV